jgi:cell division protein FtsI (penicillin-binding protein 3)
MATIAPPRPPARRPVGQPSGQRPAKARQPARQSSRRPPAPPRGPHTLRLADSRHRLRIFLVISAIVLGVFGGRLVQIQGIDGPALAKAGEAALLRTITLPALRGTITDVNGVVLAQSLDARNVTADQTQVTDPAGEAAAIAPIVGIDIATLTQRLTGHRKFEYVAKGISPQKWALISALHLPGILSEHTQVRFYPAGSVGADVVGFVGGQGQGLGGIEYALNNQLNGVPGWLTYERGSGGSVIATGVNQQVPAIQGVTVRLTINRDIQFMVQQAIADQVAYTQADSGSVVVMNPSTGAIYALAAVPTFDANHAGKSPAADRGNRAVSDVFEPGSTSKLMTMAAVLQEGAANPLTRFAVPGLLQRGGKTFHDDVPHGTWDLTLTGVLARSSNIGTILASEKIGAAKLYKYLKLFGIGETSGMNFPGESAGDIPALANWSGTSFPTIAFGQGLSVTAVQAASVFATIANGGVRVAPSLIEGTTDGNGNFFAPPTPVSVRVVSAATAATLRTMLESVVSEQGTAPLARIPGYRVAGKTGTASRVDPTCRCYRGYTASFIGMAPADAPRLVVAVFLQNPRNGHFGGQIAAPVFQRVMTYALQVLGIPPTGTSPPTLPTVFGG